MSKIEDVIAEVLAAAKVNGDAARDAGFERGFKDGWAKALERLKAVDGVEDALAEAKAANTATQQ